LTVMAYVAAITTRARLLTSVMVIPHRNPVFTAKALATLDVLSQGRVTVGCGAGWMEEEFNAIGVPPFRERGAVTDEYLSVFKELWTAEAPHFQGKYASFQNVSFLPKPVQKPHPPLWIGGESPAALRRAARFGDAWYPIGANPQFPLNSVARYRSAVAQLRQEAARLGRDPDALSLSYWANWYREGLVLQTEDGERHLLTGDTSQVVGDIESLAAVGVRHLLFNFQRASLKDSLASMERFARDVLTQVRRT
jgi:probable F420-dependent oxidoreductase